ncbi:MAG TPA: 7-cyano-7-deazaguanine synthase QueC [Verrucomicrobiae bacterium]|nr:7-cyano-7-deazaguanine synthase QueC [Verrucomicrobiae bacterium]
MAGVILLSGGLDSTVAMASFLAEYETGLALTFDYGQRAAKQELHTSQAIALHYGVEHHIVKLPFLGEITKTSLVNRDQEVPTLEMADLDKVLEVTLETAEKVWVPNRNGLFVNVAAAYAESLGYQHVVTGFNAEEAVTFPDNSPQFVAAITGSLAFSTLNGVKLLSPTQNLNKMEIVDLGMKLGIPWDKLWSCYHSGEKMCGQCESCQRLKRALTAQGHQKLADQLFAI